jgi:glycosyltransferase involved in cell wall biosynthesis
MTVAAQNPFRTAVIIPAYNASSCIEETINSVLAQSQPVDEIVVVDDGSTDDTFKIAEAMGVPVKVVRQKNGGQGSARQHGVEITKAEALLFLDADDVLFPAALEKLSTALAENPAAALVYSRVEMWSPGDNSSPHPDSLITPSGDNLWDKLIYSNFIRTPGCSLIRRTALAEAGGWDTDVNLKGNEDWELWLRLSEKSPFAFIAEPVLKYRTHGGGFSSSRLKMYRSLFTMYRKQRFRCKGNALRQQAVNAAEWSNCKYIIAETQNHVRLVGLTNALGYVFKVIPAVMPAISNRLLLSVRGPSVHRSLTA